MARLISAVLPLALATSCGAASYVYTIDSRAKNRTFDGVGALSGGGATTKLLPEYPEPARSAILDALFKPGHLAALQILKVEIGGDADSTEGSESSHEHAAGSVNCNRGYEFWLAKQAKARNPKIQLYGLPWGFPGYLGGANNTPPLAPWNARATASYIADWVQCAQKNNLTIDWVGPWNEMDKSFADYGMGYLKTLRSTLDSRGLQHTKLVGGDVHTWVDPLCDALNIGEDAALKHAVAVLGKHYPSTQSTVKAIQTGLPLWSSEDYASDNHGAGGRCEARILNQNWIGGRMTATIAWNLISSYYPWLAWANDGLMTARTPWSGFYSVDPPIYAAAHTSQFAAVGSWLLSVGAGSGYLSGGGSYVSYVSEDTGTSKPSLEFSLVIEKVPPHKAGCGFSSQGSYHVSNETATFSLPSESALFSALAGKKLSGFRSNFGSGTFMQPISEGVAVGPDGQFSVMVAVDDLITLTTTRMVGQAPPPLPTPPTDSPMPTEFQDDFSSYVIGREANLWAQASGSFEAAALTDGNKVLKQAAVGHPVQWLRDDIIPVTQLGDAANWGDTNLTIRAGLPVQGVTTNINNDSIKIFAGMHVQIPGTDGDGLWVAVTSARRWWLSAGKASALSTINASTALAHGILSLAPKVAADGVSWTRIELTSVGTSATLRLDDKVVASDVQIPASGGNVAVGCTAYSPAYFDDFAVSATRNAPTPPPPRPSPGPPPPDLPVQSKCAAPTAGQAAGLWGCSSKNKAGQAWKYNAEGTLELIASKGKLCLAHIVGQCSGKCLGLGDCSSALKWKSSSGGGAVAGTYSLVSDPSQCLDVDAKNPPNGAPHSLETYKCNSAFKGGANEKFGLDEATGQLESSLYSSMTSCVAVCSHSGQ